MPGAIGDANGVDLNTASREQLMRIGGLGEERVEEIIDNRPFEDWDDLKDRVEGFSDKLVQDLQDAGATVGGEGRKMRSGGGR